MGVSLGTDLNYDTNGVPTSATSGDPGDGTSKFFHWNRVADGGHATIGSKEDAGSTATDTTEISLISAVKGLGIRLASIVTQLSVGASALLKSEDAAHASGDALVGVAAVRKDTATALAGADGDYIPLTTDSLGLLRTRATPVAATMAQTTALATNKVVKASAGTLRGFAGYSTAAQFIQVHDASSLPADTAVPELVFPIEANKPFSFHIPEGHVCATGIVICNSSTGPTKTIGSADTWITAYYE